MIDIPCSVIAALTPEEWRIVCQQLDARTSKNRHGVPYFEDLLEAVAMERQIAALDRWEESCCKEKSSTKRTTKKIIIDRTKKGV